MTSDRRSIGGVLDTAALLALKPKQRPVNCEACGALYLTDEQPPHCCEACAEEAYEADMATLGAEARLAGFASSDDYIEHQQRLAEGAANDPKPSHEPD